MGQKKDEKPVEPSPDQIQYMEKVTKLCQSMVKLEESIEQTGTQLKNIV